ncbi:BnaAnng18920D [Brassica napus]|uniref:BnaAnng18920D protein n=2 Tax=Brassica TaxID=3705 RepID=A0A078JEY3_BRANA|nr:BnaAnng18920D [Brassica napus]VDD24377.1 unnamed protein product [Brassica rapa]
MFAAGEEPNDERVNTFHKPKRIETILEALNPEETQLVFMVAVPQIKEVVSQWLFDPLSSQFKTFANVFIAVVGAGVLGLPYAFKRTGWPMDWWLMYCFGRYLVACLGGEGRTIEFMQRQGRKSFKTPLLLDHNDDKGTIKHPFPMNLFLKPWRLSHWFYQVVKFGIVQYMIIKYPYLAVVLNFSQSWALYCLVQFYGATKDELAHIKPLAKFLTFKSVVFLTWWQGVANIALLSSLGLFKSSIAQSLQLKTSVQDFIICIEMGIASVVHLYVFPAKPYGLLGDRFTGSVSVLGDYASVDCPIDPDEIRDSERRTKVRLPHPDVDIRSCMTIKESMRHVFVGGDEYVNCESREVHSDSSSRETMEKSITKFNEKLHKISQNIKKHDKDKRRVKDDSCMSSSSSSRRVIPGIDDPLLNGSFSDSGVTRTKKHRRKSGYTSGESGGESSSDQAYSGFEVRGHRWITKD